MKRTFTSLILILLLISVIGNSQTLSQYFDGADTTVWDALFIDIDTTAANVWQIGPPQNTIFNAAVSQPNVMVTDTINSYPINNTSSFTFDFIPDFWGFGILALQWTQKLDMDAGADGGIIEFSPDNGETWENVFNNPYVYNLYGHDPINEDTLANGAYAFSGTDSLWRDMWLCYDVSWLSSIDTMKIRFTFQSDSIDSNKEGWMIDNLLAHLTFIHTISEVEQEEYIKIYPNPSRGRVNIQVKKNNDFHIIERMELINVEGRVVEQYGLSPTKFFIDIGDHPNGMYFLKIKTNLHTETLPLLLQRGKE